ncbi:MAG: 5-(carboxyamino)imidazole ribonucleotide mutase [Oscillospiraceae bacterium]|jgi:5-(carboxyamino)imidazole ribonucleotide mutase|nr:5-(carboxyamino)imidazole ribonucleotide mutase [Oscillospiraceae bacterium]
MQKKVLLLLGSISDWETVKPCTKALGSYGIEFEAHVCSAHRSPAQAAAYAENARCAGFGVIIAAAGMSAALAGTLAAHTSLPVIGIPVKSKALDGMDALLSTVMMPPGIPVAAVAIDGAHNAAVLAAQILAVADTELAAKLEAQKHNMLTGVQEKDAELQNLLAGGKKA